MIKYLAEVKECGEDWDDEYSTTFISLFNDKENCIKQLKSYAICTLQFRNEEIVSFNKTVNQKDINLYQNIKIDDFTFTDDKDEDTINDIEKFKTNFDKILKIVKQKKKYSTIFEEVAKFLHQEHYSYFSFEIKEVELKD